MEALFQSIARIVALVLEGLSILVLAFGGIECLVRILRDFGRAGWGHGVRRAAWLSFARWLLLGLEFTLAADIVRTTIAPTWNDIGQLASIALIRTFLNFFLERDLECANREGGARQGG